MWEVHERIAELWHKHQHVGAWTKNEADEFKMCMEANMKAAYKFARLKNLSYIAHLTNDVKWQHDICAEVERLKLKQI